MKLSYRGQQINRLLKQRCKRDGSISLKAFQKVMKNEGLS